MNVEKSFEIIENAINIQDSHEIQGTLDALYILYGDDDKIAVECRAFLNKLKESDKISKRDSNRGIK